MTSLVQCLGHFPGMRNPRISHYIVGNLILNISEGSGEQRHLTGKVCRESM